MEQINTNSKNGSITSKMYWNDDGYLHNENGPAMIFFHDNNTISEELYCIDGEVHRLNGPARIVYNENGELIKEEYYIKGIKLDPFQVLVLQSIEQS
jgi:antitoxin component YwqK of YwqJK toxin-antitoxin module